MAILSGGEFRSMENGLGERRGLSSLSSPRTPAVLLKAKVFYIQFRWEAAKMQLPGPLDLLNQISKGAWSLHQRGFTRHSEGQTFSKAGWPLGAEGREQREKSWILPAVPTW